MNWNSTPQYDISFGLMKCLQNIPKLIIEWCKRVGKKCISINHVKNVVVRKGTNFEHTII